jgi:hypothetical protein
MPEASNLSDHRWRSISRPCLPGLVLLLVLAAAKFISAEPLARTPLEDGYRAMYNLDFEAAHRLFQQWQQQHPQDPMGPVSDAAAYLFTEFDRLHILEAELFTSDRKFEGRPKQKPDVATKAAFDKALEKSESLAARVLSQTPKDVNALFARILANGLRGDYLAMIEKRNFAALSHIKASRALAQKLLALDPSYYDAYLAVGVENYLLGTNPAPVRWVLKLGGAETDKQEGVAKLRLTADKGHYLAPYARLLLAVAALRDKDRDTAARLLEGLAREFPRNHLYSRELARLQK